MRNTCVLILLILASALPVLPQQYIAKLNTDSLEKLLLSAKDTQRINTLNLFARRILFGNHPSWVPRNCLNLYERSIIPIKKGKL